MREHFLLDPDVVFLNHGSFGACPKPVFEAYQHWQRELERQPVEFIGRRLDGLLDNARATLGAYFHTDPASLVYITNATVGVNIIARSLRLAAGDEILATDHEYGACSYAWMHVCNAAGAHYMQAALPLPMTTREGFVDRFWQGVTPRTKAIFISHITSPTALIFPVEEICERARAAGILTIVDGAHAPGQISLDLDSLGADFYTGNLHKWLCAPKGAAFLYARPEHHDWIIPAVMSWGWIEGHTFVSANQYQGTRDPAAYLAVPAAIDFMQTYDWEAVRERCHALAVQTRERIADWTGLPQPSPESWFRQMFSARLPPCDAERIKRRLYDDFKVEVPIITWNGEQFVRVSVQGYNTPDDTDHLLEGLQTLIPL